MAVERLTDYTRRIWTGLATDAPDPDMQAGDVIYYMNTSTCSIITGIPAPGSIDTEDLPDIGGGGGENINTAPLIDSGTYTLASDSSGAVSIPINANLDNTRFRAFYIVRDVESTNKAMQSLAYVFLYQPEDMMTLIPSHRFIMGITRDTNDTRVARFSTNSGSSPLGWLLYHPTTFTLNPYSSNEYKWRAGTYHWYVWGYAAP